MSDIAQALAKAKERTGTTTAPFMTPGMASGQPALPDRSAASAAALRKARNTRRFWAILVGISLPLTAFVLWSRLKPEATPGPAAASAHSTTHAGSNSTGPGGSATATSTAPRPPVTSNLPSTPRPEIATLVSALSISAVMPGDPPRIMLAGKVIRAGDIAEGELIFSGIADGQLRFTDSKGAVYTRRY